jgi:hypothetical protein
MKDAINTFQVFNILSEVIDKTQKSNANQEMYVLIDEARGTMLIKRGKIDIAMVVEHNGMPQVMFLGTSALHYLSFDEMDIVQENWCSMMENIQYY